MQERESHNEIHWAIWIGTGIIAFGIGVYGAASGADVRALFVVVMLLAAVASLAAWFMPIVAARQFAQPLAEKSKRGGDDKLALLLSLMDDDERVAFKEALKQRLLDNAAAPSDGELPYDADSLAALLHEQDSGRRLSN